MDRGAWQAIVHGSQRVRHHSEKITHTHINRNEMLQFTATWIDLEDIMLSKISQRKANTIHYHLYVESKKYSKLVNKTEKETDSSLCQTPQIGVQMPLPASLLLEFPGKTMHQAMDKMMLYLHRDGQSMISFYAAAAKSLQSCPTLCDPTDISLPGSSVPGILQARTLEWVAISFSNACMHMHTKSLQSCLTLWDPMDSRPPGSSVHRIL